MLDADSRRVLLVLFLGVLMAALDLAIAGPALPAIRDAFEVDRRAASWVFNVFVVCNLVGVPMTTRLADRYGRRTVFTLAVLVFGVGATVVALSPSFEGVLVGRGIQGAAASAIFPAASAVVGDVFSVDTRGRALGVLGAVYGVAFLIGPALAGVLLSTARWPWLFLLHVPLAVGVATAARAWLPATPARDGGRLDLAGAAWLGLGLATFAAGVSRIDAAAPLHSVVQVDVGGGLVVAMASVAMFVWTERRAPDPLLRLELFRNPQVAIASALGVGAGLAEATFIFFSDFAVAAFAVSKSTASFMLMPLVAAVAVGAPVAGRLLDRVGSRRIVGAGATLMTAGLATIAAMPTNRVAFYGGSVTLGAGLSCLLGSALSYILLHNSRVSERTVVQGLNTLALGVGQLTGAALIGAVAASAPGASGYATAFGLIALTGVVCVGLTFGLEGRSAERRHTA